MVTKPEYFLFVFWATTKLQETLGFPHLPVCRLTLRLLPISIDHIFASLCDKVTTALHPVRIFHVNLLHVGTCTVTEPESVHNYVLELHHWMSYELSLILGVDELRIEGSDHGKSKNKTKSKESGK